MSPALGKKISKSQTSLTHPKTDQCLDPQALMSDKGSGNGQHPPRKGAQELPGPRADGPTPRLGGQGQCAREWLPAAHPPAPSIVFKMPFLSYPKKTLPTSYALQQIACQHSASFLVMTHYPSNISLDSTYCYFVVFSVFVRAIDLSLLLL